MTTFFLPPFPSATFDALNSHCEEFLTDFLDNETEEQMSYKDSNAGDIEVDRGQLQTEVK